MADPIVSTRRAAFANRVQLPGGQGNWSWLTVGVTMLTVAAVTGITAAVSYEHEYQLAHRNRQAPWVCSLLPFTVDGMILGASVVIFWAASKGIRHPLRPIGVLLVGIGATIGANLAAGLGDGWLGAAVSAWSGLALILISDVAMWLMGTLRALANGDSPQPDVACSCPRPATSLAYALPLARGELRRQGKPAGEQALADAFGVTRHQVRTALVQPVEAVPAPTPIAAEAASLNGHSADGDLA